MQVQDHQIAGAVHTDFRRYPNIQKALGIEHRELLKHRVVSRFRARQPPSQLAADVFQRPAGKVAVDVIANGRKLVGG